MRQSAIFIPILMSMFNISNYAFIHPFLQRWRSSEISICSSKLTRARACWRNILVKNMTYISLKLLKSYALFWWPTPVCERFHYVNFFTIFFYLLKLIFVYIKTKSRRAKYTNHVSSLLEYMYLYQIIPINPIPRLRVCRKIG